MDLRIRNRQVAIDKAAKQEKNGAGEDAVIIDTLATVGYSLLEDVSGRYRGNAAGWLPDQGSNLEPAD